MEDNKNYIHVKRHKWPDEIEAEKKQTRKRFAIVLLCTAFFVFGFSASYFSGAIQRQSSAGSDGNDTSKFNEIYNLMKNEWYFGKDVKDLDTFLMENAIVGLTTNEYDAHTNYLDTESAKSFTQKLEGSIVGIGIEYTTVNDNILITKVFANSPAQSGGLQSGDIIAKVDGIAVEKKNLKEVEKLIKGKEGTSVTLSILRSGETLEKKLTRASVNTTVYGYEKDGTAILELSSFSQHSAEGTQTYLDQFKKEGLTKLVIDMRGNTGGYITTAVDIASLFVEEGKIVLQEEARDGEIKLYKTKQQDVYQFDKLVVLVDGQTASASEVLTACLSENIGATVVGSKTYGKGTVQIPKMFSDGSYFKYTVAEWLTPNGEKINNKGITPDIEVNLPKALTYQYAKDDNTYKVDSVGDNVASAQVMLSFLGYQVDRDDGYYSDATWNAVKAYQKDNDQKVNGEISPAFVEQLLEKVRVKWLRDAKVEDTQLIKAMEVANGK